METLTLNDGTVLNGHIQEDGYGQLIFVYLDNMSLMDGFMILSNPGKTVRIVAESHGEEHVYEGYTVLTDINNEYGNCNATLRKGVSAE